MESTVEAAKAAAQVASLVRQLDASRDQDRRQRVELRKLNDLVARLKARDRRRQEDYAHLAAIVKQFLPAVWDQVAFDRAARWWADLQRGPVDRLRSVIARARWQERREALERVAFYARDVIDTPIEKDDTASLRMLGGAVEALRDLERRHAAGG